MAQSDEQREEVRLGNQAAVFIELESADPLTGEPARRLMCRLLDFSANGVRLRLDRGLPVGAILPLSIRFAGDPQPFSLIGEVRWTQPEGNHFLVGFTLFEATDTDIGHWKRRVADALEPASPPPFSFDM